MMNMYIKYAVGSRYFNRSSLGRQGIIVHSTGCNQRNIAPFWNVWNADKDGVCVHAIIGNGEHGFGTYIVMPWGKPVGGCGKGSKGSFNSTHIQFEICEDNLTDKAWFNKVYKEAVELCAYLCKEYNLSPKTIVCHSEAHAMGYASNHADVMHWFPKFGKSMDTFRQDVEDELMTPEQIYNAYNEAAAKMPCPDWAKAELAEAKAMGITDGTRPMQLIPRYQAAIMCKRAVQAAKR